MKNKSYIGITFIILIFGIFAIPKIVDRVSNNTIVDGNRLNSIEAPKADKVAATDLVKFNAVPEFSFTNQDGVEITNTFFKDKVYVVEFFFTTCPTICPIMTESMLTIEDAFGNVQDFAIASITINPATDTPETLKSYMKDYGISSKNWQMLTGNREAIMTLANKGFNLYAAMEDKAPGGFEHSGMFALVDKDGFIRSRKDEFGNPILCYRAITETTKDELGHITDTSHHQLTALKEDILKLLNEK